jgi:hypothetical protein
MGRWDHIARTCLCQSCVRIQDRRRTSNPLMNALTRIEKNRRTVRFEISSAVVPTSRNTLPIMMAMTMLPATKETGTDKLWKSRRSPRHEHNFSCAGKAMMYGDLELLDARVSTPINRLLSMIIHTVGCFSLTLVLRGMKQTVEDLIPSIAHTSSRWSQTVSVAAHSSSMPDHQPRLRWAGQSCQKVARSATLGSLKP